MSMTDTIANLDTYQKTDTIEYDYQPKYSSVQSLLQILPVYNLHDKTDRESVMKLFSFLYFAMWITQLITDLFPDNIVCQNWFILNNYGIFIYRKNTRSANATS